MTDQRYIDEDQLEGRTVAKVHIEQHYIYMAFTDGTWTCIGADYGWYGDWDMAFIEPDFQYPETHTALKEVGIPTKENTDGSR